MQCRYRHCLDDATRLIPYAAFAFAESTTAFLPVLKQALLRRGRPLKLYCDNGANFRSTRLSVICARLNIALIHAKPFSPAGKGYDSYCTSLQRSVWSWHFPPGIRG